MTNTMTITEAERELHDLESQIKPLVARRAELERAIRKMKSQEFIRVNRIKLGDVEMSSGDDKPWFGHTEQFRLWLAQRPNQKPWCEWNHGINRTSDFINGRIDFTASIDDLTE